jgi:hypothetical protein
VALQSLKDLGRLTYRRFHELFRHMVGLLGRVISPLQGLYLHRTTQHRNTRTNIQALSGIRTHDPSNQPAKTHASDRTATVTGKYLATTLLNAYKSGYMKPILNLPDLPFIKLKFYRSVIYHETPPLWRGVRRRINRFPPEEWFWGQANGQGKSRWYKIHPGNWR